MEGEEGKAMANMIKDRGKKRERVVGTPTREVFEKPKRRPFSLHHKLKILNEVEDLTRMASNDKGEASWSAAF